VTANEPSRLDGAKEVDKIRKVEGHSLPINALAGQMDFAPLRSFYRISPITPIPARTTRNHKTVKYRAKIQRWIQSSLGLAHLSVNREDRDVASAQK
jgi:hypothetical protein